MVRWWRQEEETFRPQQKLTSHWQNYVIPSVCLNPNATILLIQSCEKAAQTRLNSISFPKISLKRSWLLLVQPDHHHPDRRVSSYAHGHHSSAVCFPQQCPARGKAFSLCCAPAQDHHSTASAHKGSSAHCDSRNHQATKATTGFTTLDQLFQLFGKFKILWKMESVQDTVCHHLDPRKDTQCLSEKTAHTITECNQQEAQEIN